MLALYRHLWHEECSVSLGEEVSRFPHSSRPGSCWGFRVPGDHQPDCKLASYQSCPLLLGWCAGIAERSATLVIGNVFVFFLLMHLPFGDLRMLPGVAFALYFSLIFRVCGAWWGKRAQVRAEAVFSVRHQHQGQGKTSLLMISPMHRFMHVEWGKRLRRGGGG